MNDFRLGDKVYFHPYCYDDYSIEYGTISRFEQSLDPERQYAIISCKRGEGQNKYHMFPEDLYRTKGKVEEILKQEFRARVDEVKKDIHTLEDLLNFLYDNDVAIDIDEDDDYTAWVDRVAVQELAKEICGIELGE